MAERKVGEPRVVRMWAVWYDEAPCPMRVYERQSSAKYASSGFEWMRVVRVEVREVKPKKKGKVRRGK